MYEIIEHTADIGIRVKGKDQKDLFKNAALAVFEISAQKKTTKDSSQQSVLVRQKADGPEQLLVNWLNELLSLSSVEGLIFEDFKIIKLNQNYLEAQAIGSDIKNFKVNKEIKAATYHGLKLEQVKSGWQLEVILDV